MSEGNFVIRSSPSTMSPSPSLGGDVVIHGSNSTEQHVFAVVYPNIQTSIAVVVLQLLGESLLRMLGLHLWTWLTDAWIR